MFGFGRKRPKQSRNDAVRKALLREGDDGTRPRHVIHFAEPVDKGAAAAKHEIRRILTGIANVRFTDVPENPGVVFEQTREVASGEFDALTDHFESLLSARGWNYGGWECAVEAGDPK